MARRRRKIAQSLIENIEQGDIVYNIESDGFWEYGKSLKTYLPNDYVITNGYGQSGGTGDGYPKIIELQNRATCIDGVMIGLSDGATFGLESYILSTGKTVEYQLWYGRVVDGEISLNCNIASTTNYIAKVWMSNDTTLPSSQNDGMRFAIVAFRNGSGNSFTQSELEEIQALIKVV